MSWFPPAPTHFLISENRTTAREVYILRREFSETPPVKPARKPAPSASSAGSSSSNSGEALHDLVSELVVEETLGQLEELAAA